MVFPARDHVAGRDSTTRSSLASQSVRPSSSESQSNKPTTAATQKSTEITINLTFSPRSRDLGNGVKVTECQTASPHRACVSSGGVGVDVDLYCDGVSVDRFDFG